jgi:hypothetical protein
LQGIRFKAKIISNLIVVFVVEAFVFTYQTIMRMKTKFTLTMALVSCFWFQSKSQTHTITIHPNHRAASLLMTSSEYQAYITNDQFTNNTIRQNLVKDIYKKFNDDFDFIFLVLNETTMPSNLTYYGQLIKVSNTVTGIGMNNFSEAANYGSFGKLQSVMALTALTYVKSGPTLHEIMHNWGNFGIQTATYQNGQGFNNYIPHWGFTGGNTKGQLGGFKQSTLVVKGNNTYEVEAFGSFANGGNGLPYNQLELYLMGMIPVSDVNDFDVFSGLTSATDGSNGKIEFVASTRTTWNSAKITQDIGTRNPSSATSQKQFRALFVVLTPTPLTDAQWTSINDQVSWFGNLADDGTGLYNFWEATGGKATIQTGDLHLATGVNDIAKTDNDFLAVAPNPANDFIRLASTHGQGFKKINIFNTLGQLVLETTPDVQLNTIELSTAGLPNGFYSVQMEMADGKALYSRVTIAR